MHGVRLSVFLGLCCAILRGQSACPPVNFLLPVGMTINSSGSVGGGLVRQADSSYTQHRYHLLSPYTKIDTLPNAAANPVACTGYPRRPLQVPVGWVAGGESRLGTASNNPTIADLTGSAPLSAVVINEASAANVVKVARFNGDYSVHDVTDYTVGVRPVTTLAADFNGDGKRDIAVFTSGTTTLNGSVSILINNGDGTFKPAVNYAVGTAPASGTAQDFNGDGKLDLAVSDENSGLITILLGNGDGTFRTGSSITLPQPAFYVAAADLNGDSKQDLAAVVIGSGMSVLLGKGDGTFQAPSVVSLGQSLAFGVAAGDLNKDGKVDVVVVDHASASALILFGAGDGTFPNSARYALGAIPTSVVISDFDFDGNPDIVASAGHPDVLSPFFYGTDISVLFGNGDGTFYGPKAVPIPADVADMASADFNGDGRPDFAVSTDFSSTIQLLVGQSGGGFQSTAIPVQTPAGGQIQMFGILASDFNGDKKPDLLVTGAGTNAVWLLAGKGDGTFQNLVSIPAGNPTYSLDAGDLNGDGKPDLVIASSTPAATNPPNLVTVLLGNGNGSFQSPKTVTGFANPADARLGDF